MPLAVLDLDLENLPPKIDGLGSYKKAFVLIRFKKLPIGQTILPVANGVLDINKHYGALINAAGSLLWTEAFHQYIGWNERHAITHEPLKASIAICTRNRTDDLKRCLDALMEMPDDGQEVIVVDNCPSNMDTRDLVTFYPRVRYVLESRPGLDIARNRAIKEAKHEIVAFTDDDATPDNNWLRALLINFNSPQVMCVTGLTMPLELETEAQEMFEKHNSFSKGFRRVIHSSEYKNPLATGKVGAGANMALRKSVLELVGEFDEALDAGTLTHSGGDHEMFARILIAGYQIIYDPAALSWHRHRRSWKELQQTVYGYGVGVYSLFARHLILNREWSVFKIAFNWFYYDQSRQLWRLLFKRKNSVPADLVFSELKGCLAGPWAYISSRKKIKKQHAGI